jgi:threonine dehydratase
VKITRQDVVAAAGRLDGHVRVTPVFEIDGADLGGAGPIVLKLEYLQHSGTFKARGVTNFLVTSDVAAAGVVAASGGNHGAAVAWAARRMGHVATIFVPVIAAPAKLARLESYGAVVHRTGAVYSDALAASREFQSATGATAIHAYDDPAVVAGAGTTGLEFERQAGGLDTVLVACGGGGLSGGIAAAIGAKTAVVVVETHSTATFAAALTAGGPVDVTVGGLAADALGATRLGSHAWAALSAAGAASVLVSDDELLAARDLLWDRFRILVEPAAAAPVAALTGGGYVAAAEERVGIVICGANTSIGGSD